MAIYSFIAEEQANQVWSVAEMCRVLEVSRSGFYDWHGRGPSDRELSDRQLAVEIEAIWECSDRTYGVPRVHRWLLKQGFEVGRNRVARIMAINGWEGETGRRKVRTTIVDRGATAADDHVQRDFNPAAPDVVWCGDIKCRRRHLRSATHNRFGAGARKTRSTRSAGQSSRSSPSVVRTHTRPRRQPRKPRSAISRSTVQRATRTPSLLSWSHTLSAPYTARFCSHTRRICGRSSASRTALADGGRCFAA